MSVAGIQEMKWFGRDIWPMMEKKFLSGRPLLRDQERATNDSVGIALDERLQWPGKCRGSQFHIMVFFLC